MMFAYQHDKGRLIRLAPGADLDRALWIDLYRPQPEQVAQIEALGISVPTLADMEEIEISNRLYHEAKAEVMTVVIPGHSAEKTPMAGPVTFILTPTRLVTVRHHAPRPFETYPERANKTTLGCTSAERIFLGLVEEIVGRLADLLEGVGRDLDGVSQMVFRDEGRPDADALLAALRQVGRQGELLGRIRLGTLTVERMLSYFSQTVAERPEAGALKAMMKGEMRDLQSLTVHADFLSQRIGLTTDATLGMVNLSQNATVRIVSVVAALFLPPTLIASVYGMNFALMPELALRWGYPMAIGLMIGSALLTYLYFKWRRWL